MKIIKSTLSTAAFLHWEYNVVAELFVDFPVSFLACRRAVLDALASSTFQGRMKDATHMAAKVGVNNAAIVFMAGRGFSSAGFSS